MPSQKTVTKRALRIIREREKVGGKNPNNTVLDKIEGATRDQVDSALDVLERRGLIVRTIDGGRMIGIDAVKHQPRAPRFVDRTEKSPQSKREERFARGIPAYLPDDKCSPVVITQGVPRGPKHAMVAEEPTREETAAVTTYIYHKSTPYHETLTMCLEVLRLMADDSGYGDKLSVRAVLMDCIEGMTSAVVARVMKDLYAIGVYTTQMMAFQVSSYQLNLSITEITEEMVRESRQARAKKQVVEAVLEPVVSDEDVDPMQQLADIVEGQERQITELGKAIIGLDAKLNEANAEVLRLLAERQELDAENKQLREQVKQLEGQLRRPSLPDPRVAAILERHRTS